MTRSSTILSPKAFYEAKRPSSHNCIICEMASLFAASTQSNLHGVAALSQNRGFEKVLALRIALQKSLDVANRLPVREDDDSGGNEGARSIEFDGVEDLEEYQECKGGCSRALRSLTSLLAKERAEGRGENVSSSEVDISDDPSWENISMLQQDLRPTWEKVVNKLHARINFGSDTAQSKLRVFNQKIWDQVTSIRNDENRMIEKSRMPRNDSRRIGRDSRDLVPADQKPQESDDDEDQSNAGDDGEDEDNEDGDDKDARTNKRAYEEYDAEVYDDRPFYSMLLKTFITNSSGGEGMSNIRASDLSALKKYKRAKSVVDRRASKGRKIRYVAHKKLENFMFPQHITESSISSERLFKSLFQ